MIENAMNHTNDTIQYNFQAVNNIDFQKHRYDFYQTSGKF